MGDNSVSGDSDATKKTKLAVDTNSDIVSSARSQQHQQQQQQQQQSRRGSINSHIEDKIGCCLEEFRCHHNNFTGILYVGPLGIVFLGRFLLFEWTVVLKWEEVTRVKRKASTPNFRSNNNSSNSTNLDVAIRIETNGNNRNIVGDQAVENAIETSSVAALVCYDFEGFFDSHKALETLQGLHNDSRLGNNGENYDDDNNISKVYSKGGSFVPVLRRTLSSPAERISTLFNFEDYDDDDDTISNTIGSSSIANRNSNSNSNSNNNQTTMEDFRNQYSASNKSNDVAAAATLHDTIVRAASSASMSSSADAPQAQVIPRDSTFYGDARRNINSNNNTNTNENDRSDENDNTDGNDNNNDFSNNNSEKDTKTSGLTEAQLNAAWTKVCTEMEGYPEIPVRDQDLPGAADDLDAFVETFVGDDAPFSWNRFMTEITGELEVQTTPWVEKGASDNGDNDGPVAKALTRTIDYTHPVNAPMAPPTARARKEQTLTKYGNQNGLVIETKTVVSDVPMTDCFYVRDILQVTRREPNDDETTTIGCSWVVHIRFEVVFVKSTYFRALIARTTTREFRKFMMDLASFLSTNCASHATLATSKPNNNKNNNNNSNSNSNSNSNNRVLDAPTDVDPLALALVQSQVIQDDDALPIQPQSTGRAIPTPETPRASISRNKNNINNSSSNNNNNNSNSIWRFLVVVMFLWMARTQSKLSNENAVLRKDLVDLKSTLMNLDIKRTTEAQSLRNDLFEWKSELETTRTAQMQSLKDDLRDWQSALLEQQNRSSSSATTNSQHECPTNNGNGGVPRTNRNINIPRQGSTSTRIGAGGPLLVEPVHDRRLRGGYRSSGQKSGTASYEEMNDWEKLEQCNDCY